MIELHCSSRSARYEDDRAPLLEPVGAARAAAVYQFMLDHIEPNERPYHEQDPTRCLKRTAELLRRAT